MFRRSQIFSLPPGIPLSCLPIQETKKTKLKNNFLYKSINKKFPKYVIIIISDQPSENNRIRSKDGNNCKKKLFSLNYGYKWVLKGKSRYSYFSNQLKKTV